VAGLSYVLSVRHQPRRFGTSSMTTYTGARLVLAATSGRSAGDQTAGDETTGRPAKRSPTEEVVCLGSFRRLLLE
jgi:hypothetical protein